MPDCGDAPRDIPGLDGQHRLASPMGVGITLGRPAPIVPLPTDDADRNDVQPETTALGLTRALGLRHPRRQDQPLTRQPEAPPRSTPAPRSAVWDLPVQILSPRPLPSLVATSTIRFALPRTQEAQGRCHLTLVPFGAIGSRERAGRPEAVPDPPVARCQRPRGSRSRRPCSASAGPAGRRPDHATHRRRSARCAARRGSAGPDRTGRDRWSLVGPAPRRCVWPDCQVFLAPRTDLRLERCPEHRVEYAKAQARLRQAERRQQGRSTLVVGPRRRLSSAS